MQAEFSTQFLPDADSEAEARAARQRVQDAIAALQLQPHVEALETNGYTVLSPSEVCPPSFTKKLRDTILEISGKRMGAPVDVLTGAAQAALNSPFGQVQFEPCLLEEDPIFEEVLMNERVLALITYLLGESCVLCHFSSMIKGPGREYLPLHTDQNQDGSPAPFPPFAQVANATWALTDYTIEDGCICFVPGSHKLCRHPTHEEATDLTRFVPLEVPAGSVIVWHGNTWHGALPRTKTGVRVSLLAFFNRWYIRPLDDLRSRITQPMLDRNAPRFAVLTGARQPVLEDPQSSHAKAVRTSLFA